MVAACARRGGRGGLRNANAQAMGRVGGWEERLYFMLLYPSPPVCPCPRHFATIFLHPIKKKTQPSFTRPGSARQKSTFGQLSNPWVPCFLCLNTQPPTTYTVVNTRRLQRRGAGQDRQRTERCRVGVESSRAEHNRTEAEQSRAELSHHNTANREVCVSRSYRDGAACAVCCRLVVRQV